MFAVVIVGVLVKVGLWINLGARYSALARKHHDTAADYAALVESSLGKIGLEEADLGGLRRAISATESRASAPGLTPALAEVERTYASNLRAIVELKEWKLRLDRDFAAPLPARRTYYERLEAKYRSAAYRPWFHVAPDPPEPGW